VKSTSKGGSVKIKYLSSLGNYQSHIVPMVNEQRILKVTATESILWQPPADRGYL